MTKALFFDIDGTLVSFQTHVIPASTIEALTLAHEKGIQIFIATGRPTLIINNLGAYATHHVSLLVVYGHFVAKFCRFLLFYDAKVRKN